MTALTIEGILMNTLIVVACSLGYLIGFGATVFGLASSGAFEDDTDEELITIALSVLWPAVLPILLPYIGLRSAGRYCLGMGHRRRALEARRRIKLPEARVRR